jgi:uncharacterized protein (UPF0261 family)
MRTIDAENEEIGRWIGERPTLVGGPVRFLPAQLGVSAPDQPGQAFHDPHAGAALEPTMRQTSSGRLIRIKQQINDPEFAAPIVRAFRALRGETHTRRRAGGRE